MPDRRWDAIILVCLNENLGWIPGADGEPWLSMAAICRITGRNQEDMSRKFKGMRVFNGMKGFRKISDLEGANSGKETDEASP